MTTTAVLALLTPWASGLMLTVAIAAVLLLNRMQEELARLDWYDDGECDHCERPNAPSHSPCSVLTLMTTVLMGDACGDSAVPIIQHDPWTVSFCVITSQCGTWRHAFGVGAVRIFRLVRVMWCWR